MFRPLKTLVLAAFCLKGYWLHLP